MNNLSTKFDLKISILLIKQDVNEMPEICKYKVTLDRNGDEVQTKLWKPQQSKTKSLQFILKILWMYFNVYD